MQNVKKKAENSSKNRRFFFLLTKTYHYLKPFLYVASECEFWAPDLAKEQTLIQWVPVSFPIGNTQLLESHAKHSSDDVPKTLLSEYALLFTNKATRACQEENIWGRWLKLECTEHSRWVRASFAHEELKMSRIQPSCELHLGGSERERGRQAGAKPWRGAFWYNDSHLPLTGLGKVKLIMTAHGCWIAFDEVNHSQSNKQVLSDFYLPWNYRIYFLYEPTTEGDNLSEINTIIYMIRMIFVKMSKGQE